MVAGRANPVDGYVLVHDTSWQLLASKGERFIPALLVRILALGSGFVFLAGWLLACGGSNGAPDPTATPTVEPTATAEPTPTTPPPLGLDSFHYNVGVAFSISEPGEDEVAFSVTVEGDFVAPSSHSWKQSVEFAGISAAEEFVIIGDKAWTRSGAGRWQETTRLDPEVQDALDLTSADPEFLAESGGLVEGISALRSERDRVNGVRTRRYHIPREAVDTLIGLLGDEFFGGPNVAGLEDFEMTVWVNEETDTLVKAEFEAAVSSELLEAAEFPLNVGPDAVVAFTMTIDITRQDDARNQIEPPV